MNRATDELIYEPELEDLLIRLRAGEGLDFEVKEAAGGIPRSIWETVSAFANTSGGIIVLGVRELGGELSPVGVTNARAMVTDLHTAFRNGHQISHPVVDADDITVELAGERELIAIRVRAADRTQRPVFVGRNREDVFVRRASADVRCTPDEIDRMRREASQQPYDATVLTAFALEDLDGDSISLLRSLIERAHPDLAFLRLDGIEFLRAIGAWGIERPTGRSGPTVAGLLTLGTELAIREFRPVHVIDYRRIPNVSAPGVRWIDRVRWTGNLFQAWSKLYPLLLRGLPVPFRLQGALRLDAPVGQSTIREALVNLLVHTDYAIAQDAIIRHFDDSYSFENPGESRIAVPAVPGHERSDRRNPGIANLFHLAGLAEQAGSGFVLIFTEWPELGYRAPQIASDRSSYSFRLELGLASFLSEDDRTWLASLGDSWSEIQELALVQALHHGKVDNQSLRVATGADLLTASYALRGLRDRGVLVMHAAGRNTFYELARAAQPIASLRANDEGSGHKDASSGHKDVSSGHTLENDELADKVSRLWNELTEIAAPIRNAQRSTPRTRDLIVLELCATVPLSLSEVGKLIGRDPRHVRRIVNTLLDAYRLEYVYENPNDPRQRYRTATDDKKDSA